MLFHVLNSLFLRNSHFFELRDLGRKFGAKMVQALIYPTSIFLIRSDHGKKSYKLSIAKHLRNLLFFVRIHRKKGIFSMLYHVSCSLFFWISFFWVTRSWSEIWRQDGSNSHLPNGPFLDPIASRKEKLHERSNERTNERTKRTNDRTNGRSNEWSIERTKRTIERTIDRMNDGMNETNERSNVRNERTIERMNDRTNETNETNDRTNHRSNKRSNERLNERNERSNEWNLVFLKWNFDYFLSLGAFFSYPHAIILAGWSWLVIKGLFYFIN